MSMVNCAPSKLLSDIHNRLPHLSHVRFGGNFTEGSLSEILPGEIVHIGGWTGILLTLSLLLTVCFYVLCCCICVRCKKGKCKACQTQTVQQLLRYTSIALAILSVLLVLLLFWPETKIHDGINSSSFDVRQLIPEIAEDVLDSTLLSIEQQRHSLVIGYLVSLLLFMIVAIFIIFFAQRCTCGTGVFIVMTVLAGATTAVHVPLVVFLFVILVMYADVCISIYSLEDGRLCTNVQLNISSSTSVNPSSVNVFCNQTVYHGYILIMLTLSLAALFILIQLIGFCYGSLLCCTNSHKYCEDDHELEQTGTNLQSAQEMPLTAKCLENVEVASTKLNSPANSPFNYANVNYFNAEDTQRAVDELNNTKIERVPIPKYWESQLDKITLKLVSHGSEEWTEIEKLMHASLPSARIQTLQRIQNQWLWDKFSFSKERMHEQNKGIVNEKQLFHGTRSTPPEKIFKSRQGFDFRYCTRGMWGTGTYFAVNASYSDNYAFCSAGAKQLILAKVLTGETCQCSPNSELKKPPIKKHTQTSDTEFIDELFDSVSGHTNGSDIFIIYDHEKAYPGYLITYTTTH